MRKVLAVIGAAVVGFAAGVLTAPKSGKETREDLKQKTKELKSEAEKRTEQAKLAAIDSAESIKAGAQKVTDTAVKTAKDVQGNVEKRFNK